MTRVEQIDGLVERLLVVVRAVRSKKPEPNDIWTHGIRAAAYPEEAGELAQIIQRVCSMNPEMLGERDVQNAIMPAVAWASTQRELDEGKFRREVAAKLKRLVEFHGSEEVHIQIVNLTARRVFNFGDVEIHPIPSKGGSPEYRLKYESPMRAHDPTAVNAYAVVPRAPGLDTKAWLSAVDVCERVLKLIRAIGLPTLWGREWRQAGLYGRGPGAGWLILRRRPGQWDTSLDGYHGAWYMSLEDMLRNYTAEEIGLLERIYSAPSLSKMERKILQTHYWLGDATFPADNASKFAKLSIAFETAVGGQVKGDDQLREIGITQMLAERTAFLLGQDMGIRLSWHRSVTELYGSRSRVMHGEVDPISDDDLTKWAFLVWKVARALLNRTSQFATVEQFERWVRNQRYSLPSDAEGPA